MMNELTAETKQDIIEFIRTSNIYPASVAEKWIAELRAVETKK